MAKAVGTTPKQLLPFAKVRASLPDSTTCRGSQPLFAPVLRTWHVTGSDSGIAIRRVGRYRVSGESKMTARGVMTAVPKRAGVFGALDSGSPLRETSAAS